MGDQAAEVGTGVASVGVASSVGTGLTCSKEKKAVLSAGKEPARSEGTWTAELGVTEDHSNGLYLSAGLTTPMRAEIAYMTSILTSTGDDADPNDAEMC